MLVTPFTSKWNCFQQIIVIFVFLRYSRVKRRSFGLIEGYDQKRGELIMKRIDSSFDVEVGEKVISSGFGGIFPKGILIGEVTEISTDDYGLTKMAYIRPAADFSHVGPCHDCETDFCTSGWDRWRWNR